MHWRGAIITSTCRPAVGAVHTHTHMLKARASGVRARESGCRGHKAKCEARQISSRLVSRMAPMSAPLNASVVVLYEYPYTKQRLASPQAWWSKSAASPNGKAPLLRPVANAADSGHRSNKTFKRHVPCMCACVWVCV